jgi:hypothetical protein
VIRFLYLLGIYFSSNVYAGDVLYYACVGSDSQYNVAALQQVVTNENGRILSTFALDIASASDEYMTRYNQKGDIIFKSDPGDGEESIVVGNFENNGKEIGMSIFFYWKTGYRIELLIDGFTVTMPCKRKI